MASSIRRITPGPNADSARTEAISTTAPLTSCDLATWPFLRASARFLGVAFSVLFSAISRPPSGVWRADETEPWSSSPSQPATNGSEAPTSTRPTVTLAGKPTAKTLSCGMTRETRPNATSVSVAASRTGAQISIAAAKMPLNATCAPSTSEPMAGASASGTAS